MTCPSANPPIRRRVRRGFTLTEMLIVIGIIATLATIGVVVGSRAFGTADRVRLKAQLQTIEKALEAYKTDFGSYPITSLDSQATIADDEINKNGLRGARTLCKALVAATPQGPLNPLTTPPFDLNRANQDGAKGLGFRVLPRSGAFKIDNKNTPLDSADDELAGKVYGPYLTDGAVKWSKTNDDGTLDADKEYDDTTVLLDGNSNVILYYPVINSQPVLSVVDGYIGTGPDPRDSTSLRKPIPMYRSTDNSTYVPETLIKNLLGAGLDGAINNSQADNETAVVKGKPLLISAGRDDRFGPNPNLKNANDDVSNFVD